jgi:hypothetical protein
MDIIKKLIDDLDIEFSINDKINECIVYYKHQLKTKDNKIKYCYDTYDKEIDIIQIDTSFTEELEKYGDRELILFNDKGDPIIDSNIAKQCHIEAIKHIMNDISKSKEVQDEINVYSSDYEYYPDIYDKNFIQKITYKKEFHLHRLKNEKKTLEDLCDQSFFELQSHQYFLKTLISTNTGYNGVLIFHGVGVGKTCSGVSIAENFKDIYGLDENKIMILSSSNIQIGWRNTIFNPRLGENQCTSDTYQITDEKNIDIDRESKRVVKKYYSFYGYASFANMIKKLIDRNTSTIDDSELRIKKEIEILRDTFSNRILIIDEVHNIRNDTDGGKKLDRDTLIYIEKMIRYSDNLKLILLTANPMFNQSNEIIWMLNMLLLNDKRELINEKTIFQNDKLTESGKKILEEKSIGYISYLRGENPISFPIRRYPKERTYEYPYLPDKKMKTKKISKINSQKIDIFQKSRIMNKISFLELYASELHDDQEKYYLERVNLYKDKDKLRIEEEGSLLQLSNICYPNPEEGIDGKYGDEGFDSCFVFRKGINQYSYRLNVLQKSKEFLKEEYLWKYSAKIYTILQEIKNSEGIIFIYTNYLKSGVVPLALALEQNGYGRYGEKALLNSNKKSSISYNGIYKEDHKEGEDFIQGKYMIISGGSFTKNLEDKLRVLTHRDNSEGKKIKIIIGSSVASEGLDFKNIRGIHILEPWHNLNKLEQVIGRGIRNCSHKDLSIEKRNVSIYLHTSETSNKNTESIEMYLYRIAEKKSIEIGEIETILKRNAIDRELFKSVNILKKDDVERIPIQLSFRDKKNKSYLDKTKKKILIDEYYEPYDRPYSRACSFQKDCDYLSDLKIRKDKINDDTFSTVFLKSYLQIYKKRVALLFKEYYCLSLENMKELIEIYQEVEDNILYQSIEEMIDDKYTLISPNGDLGYLIYQNYHYYFQPYFNEDRTLSLYYRANKGLSENKEYIVPKLKIEKIELPESYQFNIDDINQFIKDKYTPIDDYIRNETEEDKIKDFKTIKHIFTFLKNNDLSLTDETISAIQYQYIFDRFSFDQKIVILYLLLSHIHINQKYNLSEMKYELLLNHFSQLFIYYDSEKQTYYYLSEYKEKYKKHLFGGFLYYYNDKKPIFFKYEGNKLERCNKIEEYDIIRSFKKYNRIDILSLKKNWCYLFYSKRWSRFMNGMILKVETSSNRDKPKDTFPPGEGVIIMDPVPGWYVNNMLDFIKDKDGLLSYYNKLNIDQKETLENKVNQKDRANLFYSTWIEICLRLKKNCIHSDLIWLKYNKQ